MNLKNASLDTKLIHAGEPQPRIEGAVCMPIFQSAMFEYSGEGRREGFRYIRFNNTPNHDVLHCKLAALENGEDAIVTASGMAAISTALLAVLSAGDHLLVQDGVYGGTYELIHKELKDFGIAHDFIAADDPRDWERKLRPNTRAIYVEQMTNPLLQIIDHEAVTAFAQRHKLVSLIDNTFGSPVNFRPLEWGYDLSLHSCTKYMNGHSDLVAGACIGRAAIVQKVAQRLNHLGGTLDPHAAFLLHRGLKTLALRVRYQNESTLEIAQFLESHPAVARVHYAGLQSHPQHALAKRLFEGYGGVLSFELRGELEAAQRFLQRVTLPVIAPSLGGIETLLTRPAVTSHSGLSPQERARLGIRDGLIRLSVGVEATTDLIADFERALAA